MHYFETESGVEARSHKRGEGKYLGFYTNLDPRIQRFPRWNGRALVLDGTASNKAAKAALTRAMEDIRLERDRRLLASDFALLPDSSLSDVEKQEVTVYRQALRDFPENVSDPLNPVWPEPPSCIG